MAHVINHFKTASTGTTDRAITRKQSPTAYGLADEILSRKVVLFDDAGTDEETRKRTALGNQQKSDDKPATQGQNHLAGLLQREQQKGVSA